MKILGIDPGLTTGLAMIQIGEGGKLFPILWEESKDATLADFQHLIEQVDVVVLEDWKTRPKKAQAGAFDWNPMTTVRIIGKIELLADQLGKKLVLQQPSDKPVGYGLSNQEYKPGRKGMHKQDALAHAVFYAVKKCGGVPLKPS